MTSHPISAGSNLVIQTADQQHECPDQSQRARDADVRADIYSLGCTLHKLLTGETPARRAASTKTLTTTSGGATNGQQTETSAHLSEALLRVLHQMIAEEPSERVQTAAEMA